ncbi:hypothetical protein TrRE_jg6954, partial [Triparma retinervis]
MVDLTAKLIKPNKNSRMLGSNLDGTEDMHIIIDMPFPLSARECVVRRSVEVGEETCWIITRTHPGKDARSVRKNPLRVMSTVDIGGYYMEAVGGERTRVTYMVGCDLKGVFALDWIARRAAPQNLK